MAIAILLEMLQALVARTREVTLEKTGTEGELEQAGLWWNRVQRQTVSTVSAELSRFGGIYVKGHATSHKPLSLMN